MSRRVLISVFDKSGLEGLAETFKSQKDEVFSTGGTAAKLRDFGVKVVDVSDLTGFPEVMDGRVKTLHPHVHMGLLARKDNEQDQKTLEDFNVQVFDVVVGNLYDFASGREKKLSDTEQIELIDIGGPSFLRAAAKSFERIDVICDPTDYDLLKSDTTLEQRRYLAAKVFKHTSYYDAQIAMWLDPEPGKDFCLAGQKVQDLRYGENPQQKAVWYKKQTQGLHQAEILQGKELSYNNILDLQAAIDALLEFEKPAVVSLKHTNPCGVSENEDLLVALKESLGGDPVSVFGGIVAINREVTVDLAQELASLFLECVVAPSFSDEAKRALASKKNLRLLAWPYLQEASSSAGKPSKGLALNIRTVSGGFLLQSSDEVAVDDSAWTYHGDRPNAEVLESIKFAWKVCAHLKSNAISLASGKRSVGLGMGQVSRIDSMEQAFARLKKFHPDSKDIVLASDAFFPFPDSIEMAAQNNVKWVIQPGGSIKDKEVISKASELGVNMIFTGRRHFKH